MIRLNYSLKLEYSVGLSISGFVFHKDLVIVMALIPGAEISRPSAQESSSINLMRSFILQTIAKKNVENPGRTDRREELSSPSSPSIEVKFLKKRCSSFDSQKSPVKETKVEEAKPSSQAPSLKEKSDGKERLDSSVLNDLVESGSFESSTEYSRENKEKEYHSELKDAIKITANVPELKKANKNSLKLACRNLNDGIFEDCSTYDITVPNISPDVIDGCGNEIFTNSTAFSENLSSDLDNSSMESYSATDSDLSLSHSIQNDNVPEDQPALCDTFFSEIIKGNQVKSSRNDTTQLNSKFPMADNSLRRNSQIPKKDESEQKGDCTDGAPSEKGRRNSKRIRKRNRKSQSQNPLIYDCPKCGVSYVIASKSSEEARCLHCDLCASIEPEFMKREKLTWNTCRIC
ncbi:uncharacterized protein TNCT_553821 [Trichonephila clavata]|uniref:Uncharacterized protein n=1 Tax=Trichonephila clavata TaxID=2740835 RepID=A0A8X6F7H9_TRICU|nr:uncharacterized protein TNCT_553821 [Trichonephila clavata]